jgi:hypothetical protein
VASLRVARFHIPLPCSLTKYYELASVSTSLLYSNFKKIKNAYLVSTALPLFEVLKAFGITTIIPWRSVMNNPTRSGCIDRDKHPN